MPQCNGCSKDRAKGGHKARDLVRLPVEVTNSEQFARKGEPLFMCEDCDGLTLAAALDAHERRTQQNQ